MNLNNSSATAVQNLPNTASASEVDFSINSDWGSGFQGQIDFVNQGQESFDGWTLEFEYDGEIASIWNAEIVSRDNNTYVVRNLDYNGVVAPEQQVVIGFIGEGSVGETPSSFKLNQQSIDNPAPATPTEEVTEPVTEVVERPTEEVAEPVTEVVEPPTEEAPISEPNFDGGGRTFELQKNSTARGFDVSKDRLDVGPDSIHNNIPIQTKDGLVLRFQWDGTDYLLEDVALKDMSAENFTAIQDNHLRQDISAILTWENGTGPRRSNTVYVRGHQEGLQEIVDFNPATDKVSFFYYNNRGENAIVEETPEGVKFTSEVSGQSLTLRDVKFSDLSAENFEFRGGQVEDRIDQRMGLADRIDGMRIVDGNVFSGEGIPRAGLEDPSFGYLADAYPAYTGNSGGSTSSSDAVTTDFTASPIEQNSSDIHNHDAQDHLETGMSAMTFEPISQSQEESGNLSAEANLISMPDPASDLHNMNHNLTTEQEINPLGASADSDLDDAIAQQSFLNDVNAFGEAEKGFSAAESSL